MTDEEDSGASSSENEKSSDFETLSQTSDDDDQEFWQDIDEDLEKVREILNRDIEPVEEDLELMVNTFIALEGKDQNVLEMLEEESLEETKIEIENELKQSTSESKLQGSVEEELEAHILLLNRRHKKLQEEISLLLEKLEEHVELPKLFKSLEKFVPETAMTSAWKVRSHWAGCTKQDFQWRYEAEEKLDSLGPLKREEEDIDVTEEIATDNLDVEELDDLETGSKPKNVSERAYRVAILEEKLRDTERSGEVRKVKEEDDQQWEKQNKIKEVRTQTRTKQLKWQKKNQSQHKIQSKRITPKILGTISAIKGSGSLKDMGQIESTTAIEEGLDDDWETEKKQMAAGERDNGVIDLSSDSEMKEAETTLPVNSPGQSDNEVSRMEGEEEEKHSMEEQNEFHLQEREEFSQPVSVEGNENEEDKLKALRPSQLIKLIEEIGGSKAGCLEKGDLIKTLLELRESKNYERQENTDEMVSKAGYYTEVDEDDMVEEGESIAFRTRNSLKKKKLSQEGEREVEDKVIGSEEYSSSEREGGKCTICQKLNDDVFPHPFLKAPLICIKCLKRFQKNKLIKGEDGTFDCCVWCGLGGTLFLCGNKEGCPNAFCGVCIRKNFGLEGLKEAQSVDGEWLCYPCQPRSRKRKREKKQRSRSFLKVSEKAKFEQDLEEERKARQAKWEAEAKLRSQEKRRSDKDRSYDPEYDEDEDNPYFGVTINKARGPTDDPVRIDPQISLVLKPHQKEGIRFMWMNCIDSVSAVLAGRLGRGCILAHCMGLGKTLQVVAFVHTVLSYTKLGLKTVLIVVPINVLFNWKEEFRKWQKATKQKIPVFMLEDVTNDKDKASYVSHLKHWQAVGGVFLIGYTKLRLLCLGKSVPEKESRDALCECLQNPGADILVCDEAHVIKNKKAILTQVLSQVKTRRRIALTGSPLQNNLLEYYHMLNFVREEHLGDEKVFRNRFLNPIKNGVHKDASKEDAKLMKGRIYALKKKVEGFVQRKGIETLVPYLPNRFYFVIGVRLSPWQRTLYQRFLQSIGLKRNENGISLEGKTHLLFKAYCELAKICNSPEILRRSKKSVTETGNPVEKIKEQTVEAFSWAEEGDLMKGSRKVNMFGAPEGMDACETGGDDFVLQNSDEPWWKETMALRPPTKRPDSGKLQILMDILQHAGNFGEKVLVFSHSLNTLDRVEDLLATLVNDEGKYWIKGRDYFRIDGSVNGQARQAMITSFNDEKDSFSKCFILSTKAGGLGINLIGASKVVLMDGSWNPTFDLQAIYRAWRLGQEKVVTAYRLLSSGTMEEKLYNQQVNKEGLAARVLDQTNVGRHFTNKDLEMIFSLDEDDDKFAFETSEWHGIEHLRSPIGSYDTATVNAGGHLNFGQRDGDDVQSTVPKPSEGGSRIFSISDSLPPKDVIMQRLLLSHRPKWIVRYHEHDNLLKDLEDEKLPEEELKKAWTEVQKEIELEESTRQLQEAQWIAMQKTTQVPTTSGPSTLPTPVIDTTTSSVGPK